MLVCNGFDMFQIQPKAAHNHGKKNFQEVTIH